jgi:potassium channel subfamily K
MSLAVHKYLRFREWRTHVHSLATVSPLLAGVIAPLSVLLDIPALTVSHHAPSDTPHAS